MKEISLLENNLSNMAVKDKNSLKDLNKLYLQFANFEKDALLSIKSKKNNLSFFFINFFFFFLLNKINKTYNGF
jgi:hypothetical protein